MKISVFFAQFTCGYDQVRSRSSTTLTQLHQLDYFIFFINCFALTTEPRAFRKALLVFAETVLPEHPVAVLLQAEGEVPKERLRCSVESKHSIPNYNVAEVKL